MNFHEMINNLRRAKENNRLVIFVGAGVSANSNMPSWWKLIKQMAEELGYNKCFTCENKNECYQKCDKFENENNCNVCIEKYTCPNGCTKKYDFSTDEYLKIAQYYYDKDIDEYKNFLKSNLDDTNCHANPIDNIIFEINPHHIITTNYDRLLEKSSEVNSLFFTVIKNDSDLLSNKEQTHYIIKMHGDYSEIDNDGIVLTSDSYLEYEQNHKMISTYIKALLVTHTFLFVGYGLNDYNLNLIINWVNYISKEKGIDNSKRIKHYIISTDSMDSYRENYLNKSNIYVIKSEDIKNNINDNKVSIPKDLINPKGILLYKCLYAILEDDILKNMSLKEILYEKFKVFHEFNRISWYDLRHQCNFNKLSDYDNNSNSNCVLLSETLRFYSKSFYDELVAILSYDDKKSILISKTFLKAGVKSIQCHGTGEFYSLKDNENINILFNLYLNNNYIELHNILNTNQFCDNIKFYYYMLLKDYKQVDFYIKRMKENTNSIKDMIFYEYCYWLIPDYRLKKEQESYKSWDKINDIISALSPAQQNCYRYLQYIINSPYNIIFKMNDLLKRYEDFYLKNNTRYIQHNLEDFYKIQAEAYQYYYFFKLNYFPLDIYTNPNTFFEPYIKALFISISNIRFHKKYFEGKFINQHQQDYILNDIDLDIIVKYSKFEQLEDICNKYSIEKLIWKYEHLNIVEKFKNLSDSLPMFFPSEPNKWFNLMYIINLSTLQEIEENNITLILSIVIENWFIHDNEKCREINIFFKLINDYTNEHLKANSQFLIKALLNMKNIHNVLENSNYMNIIHHLADKNFNTQQNIDIVIDKLKDFNQLDKISCLYAYRKFIGKDLFNDCIKGFNLKDDLLTWLKKKNSKCSCLLHEGFIDFNIEVIEYYKQDLEKSLDYKIKNPNVRYYPDPINSTIETLILIFLSCKKTEVLDILKPYINYSEYLDFIFNPNAFNYSKIIIGDYMWRNLITDENYNKFMREHRNEIITQQIKDEYISGKMPHENIEWFFKYLIPIEEFDIWYK